MRALACLSCSIGWCCSKQRDCSMTRLMHATDHSSSETELHEHAAFLCVLAYLVSVTALLFTCLVSL